MEQFDTILPEDFDGVFRFTNPTEEDFIGKWDSKEYLYPAMKTTPMVIVNATPLEVQNIRKKFAKDLAVREFFKSQRGKALESQEKNSDGTPRFNSIHQAAQYSDSDLTEHIQKCLTPLPEARPQVKDAPKMDTEQKLVRDNDGEPVTQVVTDKQSLRKKALEAK